MSKPPEPGRTAKRPTIEPTYVMRRRRTEALAELLREFEQFKGADGPDDEYETVAVPPTPAAVPTPPPSARPPAATPAPEPKPAPERILPRTEYETEELPPVMVGEDFGSDTVPRGEGHRRRQRRRPAPGDGSGLKRAAVIVGVGAAALLGFGAALLLPGGGTEKEARAVTPSATPSAPATSAPAPDDGADPDGPGTLREGDSGPEVSELQQRLLRIPNVYDNGSTSGQYDVVLKEAVARFQLWYGIRGDETGVYGNDTRQDLESRTTL
ncbi:peptidoglycan-binding domain-containing protein [Streptomyces sp. DSM 3412]|uniref:Peptidoglycan-binding domain-containing protein n=1 Tax=Streptomyces gottesmaniae TaxID=3075518 RepID=A0ABU2YR65_9ACTN|nr:peptidoglycan-binding domain-containing protein [Streptomyces sp. DSM 3412]MDT0565934.1 peptidoglycan-binding domain-containing protein [Streptomyces sp. DSM 3412]